LSAVAVVFDAGLARLGRVDWAETAEAASRNAAIALKNRGTKVDRFIMGQIVFGRG
jgi:hypothetical protein